MVNMKLIEEAVQLVIDLYEAEGIMETTDAIRARAINWYENTEITDAEMLAAVTITGSYQFGTSWDNLLFWKEFYFSSSSIEETITKITNYDFEDDTANFEEELLIMENFHIGEIEDAQKDAIWQ